ncbi:MAG TPA: hypothetical protein DHV08_14755 [Rhodocyclaceae bacterium]|nr:MAG: hypothetical protein CO164_06110 [Rhodocyclales bacterium CG_4_9_14_3_um_filter_68_10]HCX34676.1 hypothetical protein [Rhodocyclaceae bacterium]
MAFAPSALCGGGDRPSPRIAGRPLEHAERLGLARLPDRGEARGKVRVLAATLHRQRARLSHPDRSARGHCRRARARTTPVRPRTGGSAGGGHAAPDLPSADLAGAVPLGGVRDAESVQDQQAELDGPGLARPDPLAGAADHPQAGGGRRKTAGMVAAGMAEHRDPLPAGLWRLLSPSRAGSAGRGLPAKPAPDRLARLRARARRHRRPTRARDRKRDSGRGHGSQPDRQRPGFLSDAPAGLPGPTRLARSRVQHGQRASVRCRRPDVRTLVSRRAAGRQDDAAGRGKCRPPRQRRRAWACPGTRRHPRAECREERPASRALSLPPGQRLSRRAGQAGSSRARARRMNRIVSPNGRAPGGALKLLLRIAVTASMLAFILRSIDLRDAWMALGQARFDLLLAALAMQFGSTAVAAYRWHLIMNNLKFGQPLAFYWNSYFKGMFFNQALPTSIGGDALRVLDVARQGFRKRDALYGVAVDRVAGLGALMSLTLVAYLTNPGLLPPMVYRPILAMIAGGLVAALGISALGRMSWLDRHPALAVARILSIRLHEAFARHRLQLAASSLLVPLLAMAGFFASGRALGLPYDLMTYFAIVPTALVLTLIPISIAGWGVREGALVGLFALIGAHEPAVLMMSLLYGIMLVVVSLPGLVIFLRGRRHPA